MLLRGTSLFAALAATAALAVGTPAAGASTWPIDYSSLAPVALPVPGNAAGPCGTISNEGQGRASGNEASVCSQIGGPTFIGPSVG